MNNYYFNSSTFYVDQKNGKVLNNGLSDVDLGNGNGPLPSIDIALEHVGELRASGSLRPLVIKIIGDYFIENPIVINKTNFRGGINREFPSNVTIESFGTKKSKIIGGKRIFGFVKDEFNGRACFSAKLEKNADGTYPAFTDLYVNGKRATSSRYPETGTLIALDTEVNTGAWPDIGNSSHWFVAEEKDYVALENEPNAVISYHHCWIDEHTPIESFDKATGRVNMKYKTRLPISTKYGENTSTELNYWVENVKIGFTQRGNWYFDNSVGKVYYIPLDGEDMLKAEVYYPVADKFIELVGETDDKIDNVRFENIHFTVSKGDYSSLTDRNGTPQVESGFASDAQAVANSYGAISMYNAVNCSVSNCLISCAGIYGILVGPGCHDNKIENNEIHNMAGGGIIIEGYGTEEVTQTHNNLIKGNYIHTCNTRYWAAVGLLLKIAYNNDVCENEICDLEYSGMSIGWSWGYAKTVASGNLIRNNHIHHVGKGHVNDMGGIYLLGRQRGTIISGNRIHDIWANDHFAWGIYLDEGSSHELIENNVVYNTKDTGFHIHFGTQNLIRNNIFAFCEKGGVSCTRSEFRDGVLLENNIFITQNGILVNNEEYRSINTPIFKNCNFFDYDGVEPYILQDGGVKDTLKKNEDKYAMFGNTYLDPLFADVKNYDFTLRDDSPLLKKGFKKITGFTATGKK